jgi:hypothetical protein
MRVINLLQRCILVQEASNGDEEGSTMKVANGRRRNARRL